MASGTEQTATNASPIREKPQVSPPPEYKQSTLGGGAQGGIVARMHELAAASPDREPPPQELQRIFRSAEFASAANDGQKARALETLQRSYGNRYVQRVLDPATPIRNGKSQSAGQRRKAKPSPSISQAPAVQTKLEISQPGDALEREADRLADQVMSMPAPEKQPSVQKRDSQINRRLQPSGEQREAPAGIMRAASADGPSETSPELERTLSARRGAGQPLPRTTRDFFEPRFGEDLSGVRVHDDAGAAGAAQDINAQAFTHGRDIYFNAGKYQPHSPAGRYLLAHELAHTVQQTGGTKRSLQRRKNLVQRTGSTGAGAAGFSLQGGNPPQIHVPVLEVPEFKRDGMIAAAAGSQFFRAANYTREDQEGNQPGQLGRWRTEFAGSADWVSNPASGPLEGLEHGHTHAVAHGANFDSYAVIGPLSRKNPTREALTVPFWDRQGGRERFDVDHISELQMSGWPRQTWANTSEANFQLLSSAANQLSGRTIRSKIADTITQALDALPTLKSNAQAAVGRGAAAQVRWVKSRYDVIFDNIRGVGSLNPTGVKRWTLQQIRTGQHLSIFQRVGRGSRSIKMYDLDPSNARGNDDRLSPLPNESQREQMFGSENYLKVFMKEFGGSSFGFRFSPRGADTRETTNRDPRIRGLQFERVAYYRAGTGASRGRLWALLDPDLARYARLSESGGSRRQNLQPIDVQPFAGLDYAGRANFQDFYSLRRIYVAGMSPVDILSSDIDRDGLQIRGRILPTIPLIADAQIDLVIDGSELRVEKTFEGGEIRVPPPFSISNCSLTVSLGTQRGLRVSGQLNFEIQNVGRGFLEGAVSTGEGLALSGGFDFDSTTFNPARIRLRYENGQLSGEGELGIPSGKIRGIRRANVTANYANGRLVAHGDAEFTIPGIQRGTLDLTYSESEGMTLGGTLALGSLPGISGGSLEAQVRKPAGADNWQLSARGTATPNIPGVNSTLTVAYDNGLFNAEAQAAFSRGMLSGRLHVGVTNRPMNPEGRPVEGGEPTRTLTPYGSGQLTIRVTPWLQGTIGVRILPNGEIEVSGAIGLPSSLNIFPEKSLNKNIFSINIDIPIVGVSVLGHRIGIFATIGGGLDVNAGIGPGQLRELGLAVTYNPSHEDQTRVTGTAKLYIPAHAGLRLFVNGGLGAGIPIVSATATLEVGGSIGLEGAVEASVNVDWMPGRGLVIDALGEIYVQPKFKFDVSGNVLVKADLLLKTVTLYKKRWELASFEYGSNLRFGIRFPIHYQEGQPFDVRLSDVQFEVPHIDPMDLLTGLIKKI
jgi:hypothetical protein